MSNWYPRYAGDYARDTGDLSLMEHGAYTILLDAYYANQSPLPADRVRLYRMARAFSDEERAAVESVLERFFQLRGNTLHNKRADEEIKRIEKKAKECHNRAKKAAKARWESEKPQPDVNHSWSIDIDESSSAAEIVENLVKAFPKTSEQGWVSVLAAHNGNGKVAGICKNWLIDVANGTKEIDEPTKYLRNRINYELRPKNGREPSPDFKRSI